MENNWLFTLAGKKVRLVKKLARTLITVSLCLNNLNRFHHAQLNVYEKAFNELRNGRKKSHWMWFIFPH